MFTDELYYLCFIINAISEKNSAYKGINRFIDTSMENILFRGKSSHERRTYERSYIPVLTYRIKDAFTNFEE